MSQFSLKLSFRSINRICSIQTYVSYSKPSLYCLNQRFFSTDHDVRPRSFLSLSNPNRYKKFTKDGEEVKDDKSHDFREYKIQLYQYYHDPRASQFRIIMDYFRIQYDVIEVTPFSKLEFSIHQIPDKYHHSPLLRMVNKNAVNNTIKEYKNEAICFIPNNFRENALKVANVTTFKERIKEHINDHKGKSQEEKDRLKQEADELYEYYDDICHVRHNSWYLHDDLFSSFLPLIESTLPNEQRKRFFDRCSRDEIEFYSRKYIYTLQACMAKSFHSSFGVMEYIKKFRGLRKWGRMRVERLHLICGIKWRFQRKKYAKKAECGSQPKRAATNITYKFLQKFNENMPDIGDHGKVPKKSIDNDDDGTSNTEKDIGLIGKPFHGGRNPDILDLLVYGALRGIEGLDIYHYLYRKIEPMEQWYIGMKDEIGSSHCQIHA